MKKLKPVVFNFKFIYLSNLLKYLSISFTLDLNTNISTMALTEYTIRTIPINVVITRAVFPGLIINTTPHITINIEVNKDRI